jgi:two-component system sensor histidine kinase/response regulator
MMRQMLEALGARVLLAESAAAALRALADETPDLVLCDLRLAELDDFGLVRQLREEPRLSAKPVVAVTARGSAADYQQTWEAGFDGHFVKPIDFETVAEILGRYLPEESDPRAA